MTVKYTFANAQRSLVLAGEQLIFWHPHANTPANQIDARTWEADGKPQPGPFNLSGVEPELKAAGAKTGSDLPIGYDGPQDEPPAPPPPTQRARR